MTVTRCQLRAGLVSLAADSSHGIEHRLETLRDDLCCNEAERLREENARLVEERQAAWECAKRTRHERDEARAELARVAAQRDIALVHGPEDMIRALEELTRERDEARAEAKRYHDALVARHGGETVALLEELDASRAEVARLEGLILDWHEAKDDNKPYVALLLEARRIRAAKGE